MNKVHVLIFPAGSENAINIYDSLKYNLHFSIFGASSNKDHAEYIYPKSNCIVGEFNIKNINFLDNFNKMLQEYSIDYIIPTHDTICKYLMENKDQIKSKIICSPVITTQIAHSKKSIYDSLKEFDFIPKIYNKDDVIEFPVFLKPDVGAGGKGTCLVHDKKQLDQILDEKPNMIISENLPGEEYTVDCFTNRKRELMFIGPRTRERITMGISFKSKSIPLSDDIKSMAEQLNNKFEFRGAWFFQLKRDVNGKLKLMEFSVRQSGTMGLYRQLGINFSSLSLFDFMEQDVSIVYNDYDIELDRCIKTSYKINFDYQDVYVDFDDTLIVENMVNSTLMKFLYQCINKGKSIILITKHEHDLFKSLENYKINKNLFSKIIWLSKDENKVDFIESEKSILIDNYYKERKDAKTIKGIPVFDVDSVESLIDDSVF